MLREETKNMVKCPVLLNKTLVIGIIILFLCIAIQPGIIADFSINSNKSEKVEITIQICRGNGANDHSVMLSQEQAEELYNLLNITKVKLDIAETMEETSAIYNDTIFSLYELGILPDDMSIEDIKRLVNGMEQNPIITKKLEWWCSRNQDKKETIENFLCFIAGYTDETLFIGPSLIPSLIIILIMVAPIFLLDFLFERLFDISFGSKILIGLIPLFIVFGGLNYVTWQFIPLAFGHIISLGSIYGSWFPIYIPAKGWINSIGLKGIKTWDSFFGLILGFTGIKICLSLEASFHQTHFYMGAALIVNGD
jgi:hypothetical protein